MTASPPAGRLLPARAAKMTILCVALLVTATRAQDGAVLYAEHCARCHGPTGAGDGTEQLDRPARSFADGGFSFGDTELAIVRTLTHGIPGSPMPAFGDALDDAQRTALARHVATLMPPRTEVIEEHTYLRVVDHPVIVRGHLPPIVDGAPSHPRGMLVGLPNGFTFEYRVDDVRLLGIRQGDFVRRTDWTGRGGTPLEPLGAVVWAAQGGQARSSWLWVGDVEQAGLSLPPGTEGALAGTTTSADGPVVQTRVRWADGTPIADVHERLSTTPSTHGIVWHRRLDVTPILEAGDLLFTHRTSGSDVELHTLEREGEVLHAMRRGDGLIEVTLLRSTSRTRVEGAALHASLDLVAPRHSITVDVLLTDDWDLDDDQALLDLAEELR